jgi:putative tricarboxylic transport membrane protein
MASPPDPAGWTRYLPYALALALAVTLVGVNALADSDRTEIADDVLDGRQLQIMAPADPGGGWDQTSRAMQEALSDVVGRSEVYNVGGAGGTIGLSQFVQLRGQPNQLMVTGLIMVGAIEANNTSVQLLDTTPLARLTTDSQVIVVPDDSDIQTIDDLASRMRDELPSVSIAGGSAGGVEHVMSGLMAQELQADPEDVNYIAHAGGGEAVATLLSDSAVCGIFGISEILPQIESGDVRAIAVSGGERVEALPDTPTLTESGIDVEITNWRGVVAPPGISAEQEQQLEDLIVEMTETAKWHDALEANGWGEVTLAGPEFEQFIADESERTSAVVDELGIGEIE